MFESCRAHFAPRGLRESAWLRESGLPRMPGMLVRCLQGEAHPRKQSRPRFGDLNPPLSVPSPGVVELHEAVETEKSPTTRTHVDHRWQAACGRPDVVSLLPEKTPHSSAVACYSGSFLNERVQQATKARARLDSGSKLASPSRPRRGAESTSQGGPTRSSAAHSSTGTFSSGRRRRRRLAASASTSRSS
jgi:hypothetical protein